MREIMMRELINKIPKQTNIKQKCKKNYLKKINDQKKEENKKKERE